MIYEFEASPWRVEVGRHLFPRPTGLLGVHMWRKHSDGAVDVLLPTNLTIQTLRGDERYVTPADPRPSLELDDDMAIALLNGLAAHFGGTSDVRSLRHDLDGERKRSDRLIEALISVATRGPA